MIWVPIVASLFAWGSGAQLAIFTLALGWMVFFSVLLPNASPFGFFLFSSTLCIIPFAVRAVGLLLDRLSTPACEVFSLVALPLTIAFWFNISSFFDFVEVALTVLSENSLPLQIGFCTALLGAGLFIAASIALSVWSVIALFEFLVVYFTRSARVRVPCELFALRPLLIIFLLSLVANMAPGLVARTLSPTALFIVRGG